MLRLGWPRADAARAIAAVGALTMVLAACAPGLPDSVQKGSQITVGWSHRVTSFNPASRTGATEGNQEIAAATHDGFAHLVDGDVVTDTSFGTVAITDSDPAAFTVRYDLGERDWSDGVPLDAADLLLAWAAASGAMTGTFDSVATDLRQSTAVPTVDEFARSIDVAFTRPVSGYQTALDVAVPAHVVGEEALGVTDPMAAKQAVVDAITGGDTTALAKIAQVWNTGFAVDAPTGEQSGDRTGDGSVDLPATLTVADGPYQVTSVERTASGIDHVVLGVNHRYGGTVMPTFAQVDVEPADDPLTQFPTDLSVVQMSPTPGNFLAVRDLERHDQHVATSDDGRLWALVLRADRGVFRSTEARRAFLRTSMPSDLTAGGAGRWSDVYAATESLLFAPSSSGYEIDQEDAGFKAALGGGTSDAAKERARAGVAAGTEVCVLYDTKSPFATGAFSALRTAVAGSGWKVRDCGRKGIDSAIGRNTSWQAVLTTVPLPESPDDIATVWGGAQKSGLTGVRSASRARIVKKMDRITDYYDERDLKVKADAGLVEDAVALPLALEPVLTLSERGLSTVQPDSGGSTTLLSGAGTWAPGS